MSDYDYKTWNDIKDENITYNYDDIEYTRYKPLIEGINQVSNLISSLNTEFTNYKSINQDKLVN